MFEDARSQGQQAFQQSGGSVPNVAVPSGAFSDGSSLARMDESNIKRRVRPMGSSMWSPDNLRREIIQSRADRGMEAQKLGGQVGQEALGAPIDRESMEMSAQQQLDYELMTGSGIVGYVWSSAKSMGANILKSVASGLDDLGIWDNEVNQEFRNVLDEEYIQKHHLQSQKNLQLALEENGLAGRYAVQTGQTAADIALFLLLMRGTMAGGRAALGIKASAPGAATASKALQGVGKARFDLVSASALKTAASRAAFRFATTDVMGDTPEERLKERIKAAGMTMAYMSTPALSGLSKTGIKAKTIDLALNSIITASTGQIQDAWRQAEIEAERLGDPGMVYGLAFGNMVQLFGTDLAFSLMTKSITRQAAEAMGRPTARGGAGMTQLNQGRGMIPQVRDNIGIDNVVNKYFENRQQEQKSVPAGWEKMDSAAKLAEYYKYNTDVELRERGEAAGLEGSDRLPVEELQERLPEAERQAEERQAEAERADTKAQIESEKRAATTPEALKLAFGQGDKDAQARIDDALDKEEYETLRKSYVADVAEAEISKIMAAGLERGQPEPTKTQIRSLLKASMDREGYGKKFQKQVRDVVFGTEKEDSERVETFDEIADRVFGVQREAEERADEMTARWEVVPREEPTVVDTTAPSFKVPQPIDAPDRIDGEQQVAWKLAQERLAQIRTPQRLLTEGEVRGEAQRAGLDERNTQEMVDRLLAWEQEQATMPERILPDAQERPQEAAERVTEAPAIPEAAPRPDAPVEPSVAARETPVREPKAGLSRTDEPQANREAQVTPQPKVPANQPMTKKAMTNRDVTEQELRDDPSYVNYDRKWVRVETTPELVKQAAEIVERERVDVSAQININKVAKEMGVHGAVVKKIFKDMAERNELEMDGSGKFRFPKADIGEGAVNVGDIYVQPIRTAMKKAAPNDAYYRALPEYKEKPIGIKASDWIKELRQKDIDSGAVKRSGNKWVWTEGSEGRLRNNEIVRAESNGVRVLEKFEQDGKMMARIAEFRVKDGKEVEGTRTEKVVLANSVGGLKAVTGKDGNIVLKESPKRGSAQAGSQVKEELVSGGLKAVDEAGVSRIDQLRADMEVIADRVGELKNQKQTDQTRAEIKRLQQEGLDIFNEIKRLDPGSGRTEGQGKPEIPEDAEFRADAKMDQVDREYQAEEREIERRSRFQTPAEGERVTAKQINDDMASQARKANGTWNPDRTSSDTVGTLRIGPVRIRVVNQRHSEEAAGAIIRENKGKMEYVMFVDPVTGRATTVSHEMGHVVRDVLNKNERQKIKDVFGFDLDSPDKDAARAADERFAEMMETAAGRKKMAQKLREASPTERNVLIRGINRVVDFINSVFGTDLKHFGDAREFERLAEGLEDFGLLKELNAGRGDAVRAEMSEREQQRPFDESQRPEPNPEAIDRDRLAELGFTNDIREAGYITPDGKLYDFSGKKEGGQAGTRSYDHREAGGYEGMMQMLAEGNVRINGDSGQIDIGAIPTKAQFDLIKQIASKAGMKNVFIDLDDGVNRSWIEPSEKMTVGGLESQIKAFFENRAEFRRPSDDARFQKAKKKKKKLTYEQAGKILSDTYGKGRTRVEYNKLDPETRPSYSDWRIQEAERLQADNADRDVVEPMMKEIAKLKQDKTDVFGREKKPNKILSIMSGGLTEMSRPWAVADKIGIMDKALEISRAGTDSAGRSIHEYKQWIEKNHQLAQAIEQGERVSLNVKVGGNINGKGGNKKRVSLTRSEALEYYALLKRAKTELAEGSEGKGKRLDHAMGNIVLEKSANGSLRKVIHVSREERNAFMKKLESDKAMMDAVREIETLMERNYEILNEQYRKRWGVDLEKDGYYYHMVRDISFVKNRGQGATRDRVENVMSLFNKGETILGVNPENMSALKEVQWSDAPIIVRDAWSSVSTHQKNVAKYLESAPVKDWVDRNIMNRDVATALQETREGKKVYDYFKNISDTAGGLIHRENQWYDKLIGGFLKNATPVRLANPFVWLKQPMSLPSAVSYFGNMKYLGPMYGTVDKAFVDSIRSQSGTLLGRAAGRSFTPFLPNYRGEGSGGEITGNYGSKISNVQARSAQFVQTMMGRMDKVAIDRIIMGAKKYVEDTQPGLKGKAFEQEVAKHAANAVKMTQVATYSIDRTQVERNVQDPMRAMITYMWGARGAQFNLLAHSVTKGFKEGTPESLRRAGMVWITAGLAQSAQIVLADMLRDRAGRDLSEEETNEAYEFGLGLFESIGGLVPVFGSDILPGIMSTVYDSVGMDRQAMLRKWRVGKTGPLSGASADVMNIASIASEFITLGDKLEEADSETERERIRKSSANTFKRGRKSLIRLGSEMFGVPAYQITRWIPEGE